MGEVVEMNLVGSKKVTHKLFHCAGYWKFWRKYPFRCPVCNHGYRCYWDGNDYGGMINVCNKCAKKELTKRLEPLSEEGKTV